MSIPQALPFKGVDQEIFVYAFEAGTSRIVSPVFELVTTVLKSFAEEMIIAGSTMLQDTP